MVRLTKRFKLLRKTLVAITKDVVCRVVGKLDQAAMRRRVEIAQEIAREPTFTLACLRRRTGRRQYLQLSPNLILIKETTFDGWRVIMEVMASGRVRGFLHE